MILIFPTFWFFCLWTTAFSSVFGTPQLTVIGLATYMLSVPLAFLVFDDEGSSRRYIPQEDLEDDLEDRTENPTTYQVWKRGKLVYATLYKSDCKRWIFEAKNLHRSEWPDCVVREVQL